MKLQRHIDNLCGLLCAFCNFRNSCYKFSLVEMVIFNMMVNILKGQADIKYKVKIKVSWIAQRGEWIHEVFM